jgi:hypothetical protein
LLKQPKTTLYSRPPHPELAGQFVDRHFIACLLGEKQQQAADQVRGFHEPCLKNILPEIVRTEIAQQSAGIGR